MYRAVTLYFLENNIDYRNTDEVVKALPDIHIDFRFNPKTEKSETVLNGRVVEEEIRSMLISNVVSFVSATKEVRDYLVKQQREIGMDKGISMDGRDIGTVVFPEAELKFYLTSDENVRTQRRYEELKAKGLDVTMEEVRHNLEERDYEDSHRKASPMYKAGDAIELDNTHMTMEQQLEFALTLALEKIIEGK
jgi:cytidylate kinase